MKGATDLPSELSLGPRSSERPADAGSTMVAGIDGSAPARVDGGGLVSVSAGRSPAAAGRAEESLPWSIDWWIGADDRWHIPAREPAVRQRRVGYGPIIETSLRVPSGDVIHTVYPVVSAGRTRTVIEIYNDSPVPVALGLAIRPYSVDGAPAGAGHRLELDSGVILVNGTAMVRLPRSPNEAGALAGGDLLDQIEGGNDLSWSQPVSGPGAHAVCLYPLPHKTSLRFVVESGASGGTGGLADLVVDSLPDSESAAKGWNAIVERAARFEFPDSGVTDLSGAARTRLIMAAAELPEAIIEARPDAGLLLQGLAIGGHRFECRQSVEAFSRSFPTKLRSSAVAGAEVLNGIGLAAELLGDPDLAEALLEPSAQLTHLVERAVGRRGNGRQGSNRRHQVEAGALAKAGLARIVGLTGQHDSAAELRSGFVDLTDADIDAITALGEQAAPARRWDPIPGDGASGPAAPDSAARAAAFWIAAWRLLLAERRTADGRPVIELLPSFPTAWRGGTVEVHQAPILGCTVSFAIRWHGYRPALLWDVACESLETQPGGLLPIITCPGLDPSWQAETAKGETLLAGSADELPDAPQPGDSFA